jgi:hypothetical protein
MSSLRSLALAFTILLALTAFSWPQVEQVAIAAAGQPTPRKDSLADSPAAPIIPSPSLATATALPTQLPALKATSITSHSRSAPLPTDPPELPSASLAPTATPTLAPDAWKSFPAIPILSGRAIGIYQHGLALGNNPRAFSKIGDGEISALWFLTDFDLGSRYYDLGSHPELEATIEYFAGSFGRRSQAARRGFNTTRILDPELADPAVCQPGESPLVCELRLHRPSFAIISLGANQVFAPEVLEPELRTIIEVLIEHGVVPVLSTKADNLEGDGRINAIIAQLADEYDLPLWNFWLAVQPLPNHGLQEDSEHLTYAANDFGNPYNMTQAWPVRNLTALQVLDALQRAVSH